MTFTVFLERKRQFDVDEVIPFHMHIRQNTKICVFRGVCSSKLKKRLRGLKWRSDGERVIHIEASARSL
jgi:hypothetical protein